MKQLSSSLILFALITVCVSALAAPANDGLLFYAPFEQGTKATAHNGSDFVPYDTAIELEAGKIGKAARVEAGQSQLIYDGPGNVYSQAGTVSFFWQANDNPVNKNILILDLPPLEGTDYSRLLQLNYSANKFSLYFTASTEISRTLTSRAISLQPEQWYHFALCWDQARGVALYLDGKEIIRENGPWIYRGGIASLGLGIRSRPTYRPDRATFSASFDELRVYDRWLDDAALSNLMQGKNAQLAPLNFSQIAQQRRQLFGWNGETTLPQLALRKNAGLALQQTGIATARDVKATDWTVLDGTLASSWPDDGGYSNSGQSLHIVPQNEQPFDVIQLFGNGQLTLQDAANEKILFQKNIAVPTAAGQVLGAPLKTSQLDLQRAPTLDRDGRDTRASGVYQLGLFRQMPHPATLPASWQQFSLQSATSDNSLEPTLLQIRQCSYTPDQTALVASSQSGSGKSTFAAMQTAHLIGPAHLQDQGLAGIALELKITSGAPQFMRIEMADPLNPLRLWTAADVQLSGTENTLRFMLDHRDIVLPDGTRPLISLTFSDETEIDLGQSLIAYNWQNMRDALPEFIPDQFARAKDIYSDISEGRSWYAWKTLRSYGALRTILEKLRALEPGNQEIESYWFWTTPGLQKPRMALPAVSPGIPAWAVYLDASIEELKKVPYWWIDHRENEFGEFGATDGINDDTDLAGDWLALSMMRGPDQKLRDSYRKIADNAWNITMRQSGIGHFTDALHNYEDGLNANNQMAVLDYGNPVYLERLMAAVRLYPQLMNTNAAGHLHLYDNYYGWYNTRDVTGKLVFNPLRINQNGTDHPNNALLLHPAMLLSWYNGNQYALDVMRQWTDSMLAHFIEEQNGKQVFGGVAIPFKTDQAPKPVPGLNYGFGFLSTLNALWDLTGDTKYLDAMRLAIDSEVARYGYPLQSSEVFDRYVQATADPSFKEKIIAAATDPALWKDNLHDNNYFQLNTFWGTWHYTGDLNYIEEGTKLTLNDIRWELPMLTEAEASTDRVWTPQVLANRIALGGPAMKRNQNYPVLGASWENATGRIAPFVNYYDKKSLQVWVQNLEEKPVAVQMRLWALEHGEYHIAQGLDANQDGDFDAPAQTSNAQLARYSTLPLTLPARGLWLLKLGQTRVLDDIRQRPDLAITDLDARYDAATKRLTFLIHNIGGGDSGAFKVRVTQGTKVLLEKTMPSLAAPHDLLPKTTELALPLEFDSAVQIQLDPDESLAEITRTNNAVTLAPAQLAKYQAGILSTKTN